MRCLALDNFQKHCSNLSLATYAYYQKNEDEFRRMWSDQGLEFWIKFVISLRKYMIKHPSKYFEHGEKCEKEFIVFLKALTHKNYRELESYCRIAGKTLEESKLKMGIWAFVQSAEPSIMRSYTASESEFYSEIVANTIKFKCVGTFINFYKVWEESEAGNDFKYTPPESWYIPVQNSEPFESFIRAKWGEHRNIDGILGCKHEELAWWNVPARKVNQSKVKAKPAQVIPKFPESREKEIRPKWLPKNEHHNVFDICFKNRSYSNKSASFTLPEIRPLIHYSMLPLLQRRYHIMDARLLSENDQEHNYQGVCCWYTLCFHAFGNKYMNHIQKTHDEIKNILKNEDDPKIGEKIEEWNTKRYNEEKMLEIFREKYGAPHNDKDCIDNAMDFLLEPCIIIQLPWQPVLFRQWLSAALIEVLKFELESTEFRHWPITPELEPIVRDLLALVTDLKERILLGWTVMSYDASMYPYKDEKTFEVVLSDIVLPSINILKFLSTEKPHKILRSLKKILWSKAKQEIDDKVDVSRSTFLTNGNLAGFFTLSYCHFLYFNLYSNLTDPFPTRNHKNNAGLYVQLLEIQKEKQIPPPNDSFELKILSVEEKRLSILTKLAKANEPDLYGSKNINKAIHVIKKIIIKCKHFSPDNCYKLLEIVNSPSARKIAVSILDNMKVKMSALEHLILSCIFYCNLNIRVQKFGNNTSVLGCMNKLTAMVMEREQLIRILAACAHLLDECPTHCGYQQGKCPVECVIDKEKPMEVTEMKSILKEIQENKTMTSQELWGQFKQEWKQPVDKNTQVPKLEEGIPNIITNFENRIGRIVWNASQKAFEKVDNESEAFPEAAIVQYILPAHVAYLIDAAKYPESERSTKKLNNMILFIHSTIQQYEMLYHDWLKFKGKKRYVEFKAPANVRFGSGFTITAYYLERINMVLYAYTGLGRINSEVDSMPHFSIMRFSLQEFPLCTSRDFVTEIDYIVVSTYFNIGYPHIKLLHSVCYNKLPVPNADAILYCHELQDYYFASALLQQLSAQYFLGPWFQVLFADPSRKEFEDINVPLFTWRCELFSIVFETENKFDYPQNMLEMFIKGNGKQLLEKMFNMLKKARAYDKVTPQPEVFNVKLPFWGKELLIGYDTFKSGRLHTIPLFEEKKVVTDRVIHPQYTLVTCNNCHRKETSMGSFEKCPSCISSKYPFPNYFCSTRCRDLWWQQEHMAEHLEFELGLCDFSD